MTLAGIQLFQSLKTRLGERETEALVDYVDTTLKENNKEVHETNLRTLATKEDLWATREELREDLWATREELKGDIAKTREEIKDVKSDVIRWMFAFFITMMLAMLGLFLKH
ncbi:MAG TPA: hypothetical protein VNS58_18610 [Puia sp.]|nr:hypothetical protein [Puia sp.]